MDRRLKPARWAVSAVLVFLATLALQQAGLLARWNNLLIEKYSGWTRREVASDIVVVGIDAHSLAQLHSWPWPRSYHAKLLDFLRNAAAARVSVTITVQDDQLCLDVVDDGKGFDIPAAEVAEGAHFGLRIMRERAEGVGGSFSIGPGATGGTHVQVMLPRRKGAVHAAATHPPGG